MCLSSKRYILYGQLFSSAFDLLNCFSYDEYKYKYYQETNIIKYVFLFDIKTYVHLNDLMCDMPHRTISAYRVTYQVSKHQLNELFRHSIPIFVVD